MRWKREARVLGFDDGPHVPGQRTPVVGVVARAGGGYVETVLRTEVEHDGDDATDALLEAAGRARVFPNVVAVLTQNSVVAGFNTLDLDRLQEGLDRPVVAVSRGPQDWDAMRRALLSGAIPNGAKKWDRIAANPERQVRHGGLTLVPVGVEPHDAADLVDLCRVRGHLPEPLRLAHLIAAGWVLGESRGQ